MNSNPQLNPAVVQAVEQTLKDVVGASVAPAGSPSMARSVGSGMAYQLVAQATALAIQDSVDYLRGTEMLAQAVTATVLAKMLQGDTSSNLATAVTTAQQAVTAAVQNFASVGSTATAVATEYPAQ